MPNTILKRWNGSSFEELYPKTITSQIAASGTPSVDTFLRGDGQWAVPAGVDISSLVQTTGNQTVAGIKTFSSTLKIKETEFTPLSEADARDILGFIYNNKQSIPIPSAETLNQAVFFRPNGSDFYTVGATTDIIRRYTMSTPWDITTATATNTSATVGDTEPTGLYIKPDGLSLYVTGRGSDVVREFSMSIAWDITSSSLTFVRSFSVASQDTSPEGISFSDDGTKMFIVGQSSDRVYQYNLSTAWNISTAVYNNVNLTFVFPAPQIYEENVPVDISFALGGTRLYVLGTARDNLYTFKLSTPFDLSTAQFFTKDYVAWNRQTGLYVRDDLSQAFIIETANRRVFEYVSKTKALQIDTDGIILNSKLQVNGDTKINGGLYVSSDSSAPFVLDANAPSSTLKIQSATSIDGGISLISVFNTAVVSNNENGPLWLQTNASQRMAITATGLVGIGTTAPLNKFQVNVTGADSDNGIMIVRADTTTTTNEILGGIGFDSTDGNVPSSILEASAYIAAFAAEDHSTGDKGGYLTFGTAPIDQDDDTVSTERMRIRDDGLVGINETSFTTNVAQLVVKSGATDRVPLIVDTIASHTANLQVWQKAGVAQLAVGNDGSLANATAANSKLSLTSTGALIERNINDAEVALKINQQQGTGKIVSFQFGGVEKSYIDKDGNFIGGNLSSTLLSSDFVSNTTTYATCLEVTNLEANSVYEIEVLGAWYKEVTNANTGIKFAVIVNNTTGTPTFTGALEFTTNLGTITLSSFSDIGTTVITGAAYSSASYATSALTNRHIKLKGLLYTGTSTKTFSFQMGATTSLSTGFVGVANNSFLIARKVS
jgi:hypothetical protein